MASFPRVIITILVILLLAAVVSVAVLAVLLVEGKKGKDSKETPTSDRQSTVPNVDLATCDDVAIIGAGIAGAYSAWRLRTQGKKVTVYEYSDRIGGRCHTVKFPGIPDVNLEMGAMRFKPLDHPLLNRTVHELGLTVEDFMVGYGYHPNSLIYIRGKHLRHKDLKTVAVPYNLEENMRIDFDQLNWEIFANNTDINPDLEGFMDDTMRIKTKDGVELWEQSRQGFYFKYLNTDTAKYLQDVGFWDGDYRDVSAAQMVPWSKPDPTPGPPAPVKTVATGFQSIPEAMIREFLNSSDRHMSMKNHQLKSIQKHKDRYILTFQPTETVNGVTKEVKLGHYLVRQGTSWPDAVCWLD